MALSYFASHISDNILVTPSVVREDGTKVPGRLICKDAVIARTGWQTYQVADLDPDEAAELGVDLGNPGASIELYRPEEEVFSPATIASFETAPVTLTHPDEFVAADNWRDVAYGHVQNVRRGTEPLESGEIPLLADVIINTDPLISDVLSGRLRQISCGYRYRLARDGDKLLQTAILGNHVALVPKGRAGPEARIYDAAPALGPADTWDGAPQKHLAEVAPPEKTLVTPELRQHSQPKETVVKKNWFAILTGLGLKQLAADPDTKPEDLNDAAMALRSRAIDSDESEEDPKKKEAEDARRAKDEAESKAKKEAEDRAARDAADKKARDEEEQRKNKEAEDAKRAKDAEEKHFEPCKVKDCMDRDCRMHRALDSILEKHPKEEGEDADMEELSSLLQEFLNSEAAEDKFAGIGGRVGFESDEAGVIQPEPITEGEMDRARDGKSMGQDGELKALLRERKSIVDSGDRSKMAEFNARLKRLTGSSTATNGSHAAFALGARARDRQMATRVDRDKQATDTFRGMRGKFPQEVK